MKKIYTILKGGLGNQLFIYCTVRRLALYNSYDLYLDTSFGFDNDFIFNRKCQLSYFNIPSNIKFINSNESEISKIYRYYLIFISIFSKSNKKKYILEKDKFIHYDLINSKLSKNTFIEGYWQNEIYFKDIKNILLNELTLKIDLNNENMSLLKQIKNSESVCIHVRNYDKNITSENNNLPIQYYYKAIEILEAKHTNLHFYIFSDYNYLNFDFLKNKYTIVNINNNQDYLDLNLMKECKYLILTNSTFSWWAGWLSNHNNVICPNINYYNPNSIYKQINFSYLF